jgi:hypothetical protein
LRHVTGAILMSVDKWTDDFLASMRQVMDPQADEVITRLFADGGPERLNRFHGQILRSDGIPVDGLPDYVVDYLKATAAPPAWMNHELARHAQEVLTSNGLIAFTILGCASLPECYVDRPGVPALWLTQNINAHVYRRIVETAQFVIGVMSPGGMERNGKGLQAAQKVRLMHASIRHLVLAAPDEQLAKGQTEDIAGVFRNHTWKTELGLPLNQEDLAYTLQTFAWVGIRGMRALDCHLTPDQEEGIVQVWNAAGFLMGIREDLLPANVKEAEILFSRIKARVAAESEPGKSMEAALLNYQESMMPGHLRGLRHLPRMVTRHLVGDATADMLGIPELMPIEKVEARLAIEAIDRIDHIRNHVFNDFSPARKAAEYVFRRMVENFMSLPKQWERELFQIPDHLSSEWKVARMA